MGVRDQLRQRPAIAVGLGVVLVVVAVALGFVETRNPNSSPREYYSDDDGATYFAADAHRVAPFDHDGKQAVRAHVYSINGKPTVVYLSKFSADRLAYALAVSQAKKEGKPLPPAPSGGSSFGSGEQVKRPGEATWVSLSDIRHASAIINVRTADGQEATPLEP